MKRPTDQRRSSHEGDGVMEADGRITSANVVMYWLEAQRIRQAAHEYVRTKYLPDMVRAASRAGLDLVMVTVDDVVVRALPDGTRVLVQGSEVRADSCFFHTKLMTWPDAQADAWRMLSLFDVLEAAGFHTTVPTALNITTNDKLLTLLRYVDFEATPIPTWRISTRQFTWLPIRDLGLDYPLVVKPANWGAGYGIVRVETPQELQAVLQLSGAGELNMVIQPWLGPDTVDYRVYCIDGIARRACTRKPQTGAVASNTFQGGALEYIDVPQRLVAPAERIAKSLGLAYACVDFLEAGGKIWLSEIEADGAANTDAGLSTARFAAYRRQFDRYVRALRKLLSPQE
jgi:glutathione synthase/RimK-type ligase-like ATP-grasp enzyme